MTDQGMQKVRKNQGWHDEPLKGNRQGQRSLRLNEAYRAIFTEHKIDGTVELIEIQDVNKYSY